MKQDRFLIGILVFIGLLVITALVLFFVRQDIPQYGPEDTPEGIVRNYALAVYQRDFTRAYGYLAELDDKPTYDSFVQAFLSNQLDTSNNALQVGETQTLGGEEAWVTVTVLYGSSGPFSDRWSSSETARLVLQNGAWKITYLPYPYWGWDWYQPLEP
ncbi:MAG: hypothetical protein ABIJ39_09535 [Chloroflexota bacterium]